MIRNKAHKILILVAVCCGLVTNRADAQTASVVEALLNLKKAGPEEKEKLYGLLQREGDQRLVPILEAYQAGLLENRDGKLVIYGVRIQGPDREKLYPLLDAWTGKPLLGAGGQELFSERLGSNMMRADRADRKLLSDLIKVLSLQHSDPERRIASIQAAGERVDAAVLPALQKQLHEGPSPNVARALTESIAHIQLVSGDNSEKIQAAGVLGKTGSSRASASLKKALMVEGIDPTVKVAVEKALERINRYQWLVKFTQNLFSGLSLGSILILMALGLAVILGLMGVINMAHGEFMMLGAFTAYVVCELFKRHLPPELFNYYFVCAVPASFAVTALAGWVCEWALIRHMYGRPLETLLATWGLSLVLIQTIRVLFGDTLALTPPDWFKGSWEVAEDMVFPLNRLFIIVFCACCALLFYLVVRKTKLGLLLRATVQDRDTASSLGVPTRRVDGLTFGLGTGLAGLAGCVIPLYDKINPGMGQGYVVDSFMVVVLGGLGKLAGVIVGGVGLGFLSKFIEPFLQAVYGKAVVLAMIVLFLQWRPAGLFPSQTRLADE
jgi:urea transport system permease protein